MTGAAAAPSPEAAGRSVAVVGAGPAGLMAAEALAGRGRAVQVFDAMPSAGRKFLLAGKGGLNLTHSEAFDVFAERYGDRTGVLKPLLAAFGAAELRAWAQALGIVTFIGSSGRVFPAEMKAAPLLRTWLHRLRAQGVALRMRHRWLGWDAAGGLRFAGPDGEFVARPAATVLALGGASWPRLGSDGAWVEPLRAAGAEVAPLQPANCGFDVGWTAHFAERHAGAPLKSVELTHDGWQRLGECVVTAGGIEGSLVYAASARLRDAIARDGTTVVHLDLLPARTHADIAAEIARPRGARSLATHLKSRLGLAGAKAGLVWECVPRTEQADAQALAARIKALPLRLLAPRPLAEAISTAGGVRFEALDGRLMLKSRPGTFCAGEMLDWEAPTGGYLLTACCATGRAAGMGAADWLAEALESPR